VILPQSTFKLSLNSKFLPFACSLQRKFARNMEKLCDFLFFFCHWRRIDKGLTFDRTQDAPSAWFWRELRFEKRWTKKSPLPPCFPFTRDLPPLLTTLSRFLSWNLVSKSPDQWFGGGLRERNPFNYINITSSPTKAGYGSNDLVANSLLGIILFVVLHQTTYGNVEVQIWRTLPQNL